MSIKITDNFQVNIKNPIDNRFVVGSQSIPGGIGSIYPTPFYSYRDDISSNGFVYPGLRIWDFNSNLPYVWTGTTWSNENLTGASVYGSGTPGGTGFQNYITKFQDNNTVLTKSLLFDDNVHVSLGSNVGTVNPNGPAGSAPSVPNGLHVSGRIRTNTGFVGIGKYITGIDANNISEGSLNLLRISTVGTNTGTTILTNINGTTLWKNVLDVVPFWEPGFIGLGTSGAVSLYNGAYPSSITGTNKYEFFSLVSNGLNINPGDSNGNVRIESKVGNNVGGGRASIYKGLNSNSIHEFKTINSNFMSVTETTDNINLDNNISSNSLIVSVSNNGLTIELPTSFEGTDYYVNGYYSGEQLGTRSKPFQTLTACIDKILNRTGAVTGTHDPLINNGNSFKKWEIRTGRGETKASKLNNYATNLPGGGAVRVIIQSYTITTENLAINGVTYFLEKDYTTIEVLATTNNYIEPGSSQHNQPFEYLFDMKYLVDNAERGNPMYAYPTLKPGELDYQITCRLEGTGALSFQPGHNARKGFARAKGTNSYDWTIEQNLIGAGLTPISEAAFGQMQHGSRLDIGSVGGNITFYMSPTTTLKPHISEKVPITNELGGVAEGPNHEKREGVYKYAYKTIAVPDYGVFQVEGRNLMFAESLFLNGTLAINCHEQHMIYLKDYAATYSDNGRIFMRRNYQHVLFSNIDFIEREKPKALDYIYAGNWYKITSNVSPYTNWKSPTLADQSSWRNQNGDFVDTSLYPLSSPSWVGLSFKCTNNYTSAPPGNGKVAFTRKLYLPSNHVYDIYLKNGSIFAHGGDFYTQQNTGASDGGPCAFVCLENNVPIGGDARHPQRNGGSSTMCSFSANGGGNVTNLFYNHIIKNIMDVSYEGEQWINNLSMKSLKIDSAARKSIININRTQLGSYPDYATENTALESNPSSNWTQNCSAGTFRSCLFYDIKAYTYGLRTSFSNLVINNGSNSGRLSFSGTPIDLSDSYLSPGLPYYTDDAVAAINNLPIGAAYRIQNAPIGSANVRLRAI